MKTAIISALAGLAMLAASPASAQVAPPQAPAPAVSQERGPSLSPASPGSLPLFPPMAPEQPLPPAAQPPGVQAPSSAIPRGPATSSVHRDGGTLSLSAVLGGQAGPIRSGVVWRVYSDPQDGTPATLLQESRAAAPTIPLEPGVYTVHAAYGLASAIKRVVMGGASTSESLVINAGGLILGGVIGDAPIPPEKLRFNVYVPLGNDPEGRLVVEAAHGGALLRLPEGGYRVVSTYGDSNAIMSADLKVEAGRITEATLRHKAATIILKLVTAPGSEALANTAFSVLTPGGDTIREAIGAFPSMTLAEGEYVAIARNGGKVYTQEFSVKSGLDRDIEVLAR
jgi:hypothetical protein